MQTKRHNSILKLVIIALFAALAYVLSLFPKFNLFPIAPWMDVDLSDFPALMISVVLGPLYGCLVLLIKSTLHLSVSLTGLIGFAANMITGGSFVISAGFLSKLLKRKDSSLKSQYRTYVISLVAAIIPQLVLSLICNLFVLLPLYGIKITNQFGSTAAASGIIIAHNAVKDTLNVALTLAILPLFKKLYSKYQH